LENWANVFCVLAVNNATGKCMWGYLIWHTASVLYSCVFGILHREYVKCLFMWSDWGIGCADWEIGCADWGIGCADWGIRVCWLGNRVCWLTDRLMTSKNNFKVGYDEKIQ
jgi:hypothetical protein